MNTRFPGNGLWLLKLSVLDGKVTVMDDCRGSKIGLKLLKKTTGKFIKRLCPYKEFIQDPTPLTHGSDSDVSTLWLPSQENLSSGFRQS